MEDDEAVKQFVGPYDAKYALLDTDDPIGAGMFAMGDCYMKSRLALRKANDGSLPIIEEYGKKWAEVTGRPFELVDAWGTEDADYIVVVLGSAAGNVRHIARELRAEGKKVGVVRPRVYRPFPAKQLVEACKGAKAIAVLDRSDAIGAPQAPLAADTLSALYDAGLSIPTKNYVYGLGGQDVTNDSIRKVFADLEALGAGSASGQLEYLGI